MATLLEKANQILNEKNEKVLPENIKKDITIYGVTGTLETSGAKVFSTQEEMQADTTAQEGDLAVVYRSEIQNATVDSKFQVATFPETVVLDTAITDYVDIRYRAVDSSVMFDCMGSLNRSRFSMNCYTESGSIDIEYTSTDGITYTRTDTTGNPVDFGTEIYYEMAEMWNDAIGKFIQIGGNIFEGLYEYKHISKGNFRPALSITKSDILSVVNGGKFTNPNTNIIYVMKDYTELQSVYAGVLIQNSDILKTYKNSQGDTITVRLVTEAIFYNPGREITVYNDDVYLCDTSSYNADDLVAGWNEGYYILQNDTITFHKATSGSDLQLSIKPSNYSYWVNGQSISNQSFILSSISTSSYNSKLDEYVVLSGTTSIYDVTSSDFTSHTITNENVSVEDWKYVLADTQLSVTPEYVYEKEFYGKNGLETGTLTNVENLTLAEVVTKTEIFSLLSDIVCPASMYYAFKESQLEHIDISNLDFSNTTNMGFMFYGCSNLKSVNFGTMELSNVTSIDCLFGRCTSLETIDLTPLTGCSPTNGYGLFSDCTLLKRIDLSPIDLSKLTSITHMLMNCINLEFADLSSIDFGGKNPSREFFMDNVPDTCEILVKDQASKNWFSTYMSRFTNVKIKS